MAMDVDGTETPTPPSSAQLSEFTRQSKPSRIVIDPEGDLCLTVGEERVEEDDPPVTFLVCSKTMARTSPVWKRMLYGGFAESVQPKSASGKEWIVSLPEDHPQAVQTLLNIMHGYFDKIPLVIDFSATGTSEKAMGSIDLYHLYCLTVVTDKYDCTRIIRPWAKGWTTSIATNGPLTNGYSKSSDAQYLPWIFWELGDVAMFRETAKHLILNCTTNSEGELQLQSESEGAVPLFGCIIEPPDFSTFVRNRRLKVIEPMLKPVQDAAEHLLQKEDEIKHKRLCKMKNRESICYATMLGVTCRSLTHDHLWPVPRPEELHISTLQLAYRLLFTDSRSRLPNHEDCFALTNIEQIIKKSLGDVSSQLAGSYTQHLQAQADKTGLSS
ncbi:hypothetical protein F4677DRAFT_430214 [Hypoxylon crocopeplum]|nr:hypothetical protein F4677DRAFT_430214 [Hypoxylon crocopeplum]